jgi:hypothetical protein
VPPDYLTAMKNWALYAAGQPGMPDGDVPDTIMYYNAPQQAYLPVPPGTIVAAAVFLHCLADCYSHEECMVDDTVRSHPLASACGGNYHYLELPYLTDTYAAPHAHKAAQALWRMLRECIRAFGYGYAPRWTADQNGFEDGDGVPDELEDNGDGNHTDSFIERWKSPALRDLNDDHEINHFDHTIHRIQLAAELLHPQAVVQTAPMAPFIRLQQNCPNPFNATTRIAFDLPEPSRVILHVYNLVGREVAVLLNDEVKAGWHEVVFYAANLPSGVYWYRLEAAHFTAAQKMLLLK